MTQAQIDYQMQLDLDDHLEQCGTWDRQVVMNGYEQLYEWWSR